MNNKNFHFLIGSSESKINIKNYSMVQSIDFPITGKDTVTLTGALETESKYGNGSVTASLRRIISNSSYLDVSLAYF